MDLELKLTQTGNTIIRLNKIGDISNTAYDELMQRNEETIAMLHEKACAKAKPTNERTVLPINIVMARLLYVIAMIITIVIFFILMMPPFCLIYWVITGRNVLYDFYGCGGTIKRWLNVP